MKKIIPVIILVLTTVDGFSKCASSRLYFWPSKQTVSSNSIFVIDGYATSQKIIIGLGTTYKVYLKSADEKIKLNVQELLVGQYNLTQAVLKPEKILAVGKEYELVIENLGDLESQVTRYNDSTKQKEKIKWTASNFIDTVSPNWTSKPEFTSSSYDMYGCGPATFANFTFAATDNSEFLIKTTVKNKSTGKETTFYLQAVDQLISVGHGMCAGAFDFQDGDKFEVAFSLFDASGNITHWTGDKLEFKRPT
ncbi:hypothetical protein CHX27_06870 [Flavobacterium aurantiibacter]|uniref:Uncharacterized protein n=1 Tax=Flavobacterium aurantiibacter TaxID=2023067 RepID=A0A255ZW04_9FLAO|nr:hypothetical protein CHX27_06870 [Flavobacterium aurantiibacter]